MYLFDIFIVAFAFCSHEDFGTQGTYGILVAGRLTLNSWVERTADSSTRGNQATSSSSSEVVVQRRRSTSRSAIRQSYDGRGQTTSGPLAVTGDTGSCSLTGQNGIGVRKETSLTDHGTCRAAHASNI